MKSNSLMTDCAMALAKVGTEIVSPCLREEERREYFNMLFEASMAMLSSYEEQAHRMRRRVKPSDN